MATKHTHDKTIYRGPLPIADTNNEFVPSSTANRCQTAAQLILNYPANQFYLKACENVDILPIYASTSKHSLMSILLKETKATKKWYSHLI